jgi:lipopolysaccharide biosynthesis protein
MTAPAPSVERNGRMIAFYLPQFYPTLENDGWWGPGFTEWTNVVQGRPLFDGHYQPRLPADLGFCDLRVPEVRQAQADLAAQHGIEAFCYWHYWFHGTRVLERPFEEVLASGEPALPFCLSWANETWARRWHGSGNSDEVLREQTYSEEDDVEHARWLLTAFADPRYVRINDRPLFLVYRPFDLPDARRTTEIFRRESVRAGLPEPYLLGINAHLPTKDTRSLGFDCTLNFEPQLSAVPGPTEPGLKIYDYTIATQSMRNQTRDYPTHPCVMVSWDNTPRQGDNGIVFINSKPETFEQGLRRVVATLADDPLEERVVLLNAWNEWAEGNHLEPDLRYGLGWLEAVRRVAFGDMGPDGVRNAAGEFLAAESEESRV